jgi:NADH:ubiquinone oxidoreductase subunit F (NADH-binding)
MRTDMALVSRVLPTEEVASLDVYLGMDGGEGLQNARGRSPASIIDEVEHSGLRGRGGAGFPTARKWRTVASYRSPVAPTTVVINGAEGEPGTFKDRTIMRLNPYRVVEGALIAARAVAADVIVFALKRSFGPELDRLRAAVNEFVAAGLDNGVKLEVFGGPNEYLYGEETALLEVLDGRYPFPRVAPPFRHGLIEVVEDPAEVDSRSGLPARRDMAAPHGESPAPPTLVDNVETIANVPGILGQGAAWFRAEGTPDSPGTIVCTVTGATRHAGVGEVLMGEPLREIIKLIGGGPRPARTIRAVLPGTASGFIPEALLDTPASYEALAAVGSGLGSAGFIVFDDTADLAAVAAGASRFLAVESCGQCVPCKQDGLDIADALARVCGNAGGAHDVARIKKLAGTVADRARCSLASQHEAVVTSLLEHFSADVDGHVRGRAEPTRPVLIADLRDIEDGRAIIDQRYRDKQPDWSHDEEWSGKMPAELFADHRLPHPLAD